MSRLKKVILLFLSLIFIGGIVCFFSGLLSLPADIQKDVSVTMLSSLVIVILPLAGIVIVLAKFHSTLVNMSDFASVVCDLGELDSDKIKALFFPVFKNFLPPIQTDSANIFLHCLRYMKYLHEEEQLIIKPGLQRLFDLCLHKLSMDFWRADKNQMVFRRDWGRVEDVLGVFIANMKETKSASEINTIYKEKDTLQKNVNESKEAFNKFRDSVRELGFATWPDYKAYVLLKVN